MVLVCTQPEFHGMLPALRGTTFADLQHNATRWPTGLRQCVAVCNSLNRVNKYQLVGDAADFKAFNKCEAHFVVRHIYGNAATLSSKTRQ